MITRTRFQFILSFFLIDVHQTSKFRIVHQSYNVHSILRPVGGSDVLPELSSRISVICLTVFRSPVLTPVFDGMSRKFGRRCSSYVWTTSSGQPFYLLPSLRLDLGTITRGPIHRDSLPVTVTVPNPFVTKDSKRQQKRKKRKKKKKHRSTIRIPVFLYTFYRYKVFSLLSFFLS